MKNIYVGSLSFKPTEEELRKLFEPYGAVQRVTIPRDSVTLKLRGFAFVEMPDDVEAERAIRELNGSTLSGRGIVVNEARPKPERAYSRRSNGGERRFGRS